jgi:hypothetical protein
MPYMRVEKCVYKKTRDGKGKRRAKTVMEVYVQGKLDRLVRESNFSQVYGMANSHRAVCLLLI